jgi:hypothetical protein
VRFDTARGAFGFGFRVVASENASEEGRVVAFTRWTCLEKGAIWRLLGYGTTLARTVSEPNPP